MYSNFRCLYNYFKLAVMFIRVIHVGILLQKNQFKIQILRQIFCGVKEYRKKSQGPPNPGFMQEKVQKGNFLKKDSRESNFFSCFRFL